MMSSLTGQIKIEQYPNRDLRGYHTRAEVCRSVMEHFDRPLRSRSEEYLAKAGPLASQIVRRLMAIKGINGVTTEPYCVAVKKAKCYTWEELEPIILKVVRQAIFDHPLEQLDFWARTGYRLATWWYSVKKRLHHEKKAKWPNPKIDRDFRCVACGAVTHGSKLGHNCGIPWLPACPEPGCGANVLPVESQK